MRKLVFAAAALLLLASCNRFQTKVYEDDFVLPLAEESQDSLFVSISIEYVDGGLKKGAIEGINNAIISQAFDFDEVTGTLEECGINYREQLIDLYLNENDGLASVSTWEDQLEGKFLDDCQGKKNYMLTYYSFRGGAHGIMTVSYLVFNPKTGALVTEKDLFKEGYEQPVSQLLQEDLKTTLAEDPELLEMIDMALVAPNGNFFLDAQGICWVYQPYDIAPYALGILSASVSWDRLKPYLK